MPNLKSAFTKAKTKTSDIVRSFSVAALTTAVPAGLLGTVYAVGSGLVKATGLPSGVSTGAGIIGSVLTVGVATGAAVVTGFLAHVLIGPENSWRYNDKAVLGGIFTGLAAAGALTWHLSAGDPAKQPTPPAQPALAPVSAIYKPAAIA